MTWHNPTAIICAESGERTQERCLGQRRGHLRRRLRAFWCSVRHKARHRVLRWITLADRWSKSFRIAYGHIEFERARDYIPCRIGPALRVLPDQSLVPHERTEARALGIQALKANFGDWVPQMDLEIFLFGFQAGEQFVLRVGSEGYNESFLAPERGGNSMPPPEVQQWTKHDSSNPLPSQG
jgi:hypothetical protein